MKKNTIIPLLLFAAVFCVSQFLQPYWLTRLANNGLFLLTPDWLGDVLHGPHPLSELVGSFLVQFYDIPVTGPLIVAAVITVIYLCEDVFLRKCGVPFHALVSLLTALACWYFTARLDSNLPAVRVMLAAVFLGLVSLLIKRRTVLKQLRWELPAALTALALMTAVMCIDGRARAQEAMARAQAGIRKHDWDGVLKFVTPGRCTVYPELIPYAVMALGEKDMLADNLFRYPVSSLADFGMEGDNSLEGCLYNSILNECLGVPNEAIHQIYQYSCHLPHGMSHLGLAQLARYSVEGGNFTLARKYAGILMHNPRLRSSAKGLLRRIEGAADVADTLGHSSSTALVMTKSPQLNLAQMSVSGINSMHAINRYLCYMLMQGDVQGFRQAYEAADWGGRRVPLHYQEALLLAGADPSSLNVSEDRLKRFSDFMVALAGQQGSGSLGNSVRGTYWEYYLRIKDKELSAEDSDASYPAS